MRRQESDGKDKKQKDIRSVQRSGYFDHSGSAGGGGISAFGVYWVAGGKNGGGAAAETKTYTYVVEGRQVLNETANFPEEGGKVFDSTSSAYLGTVKSCWTEPFREVNFNRTTNKYEMLPVPGYCNIYVEIEGSGTETDQDITVEGNVVKVGKEQNVKGKGYAFKGYIVEVRDGE